MGAERNNASKPGSLRRHHFARSLAVGFYGERHQGRHRLLQAQLRAAKQQSDESRGQLVNLGNSLFAIKKLVYEDKAVTLSEFKKALDANWQGHEELRKKCLTLPKYGNDIAAVDRVIAGLYDHWGKTANTLPAAFGGTQKATAISVTSHQPGGAITAATPDGRLEGTILAYGCASPASGTDTKGPLAVFKSAMNIPQDLFAAMLLNMKFHPSALKSEEDRKKLAAAMKTYFFNGGKQVQFNVVDRDLARCTGASRRAQRPYGTGSRLQRVLCSTHQRDPE